MTDSPYTTPVGIMLASIPVTAPGLHRWLKSHSLIPMHLREDKHWVSLGQMRKSDGVLKNLNQRGTREDPGFGLNQPAISSQ